MAGQWRNKYAIMRDLSMAQGCVPVDVDRPVGAEDKPPDQDIVEETEEEFFKNCVGDGDFEEPDLGLIKQMLDMVREPDASSDSEEANAYRLFQISKLNPLSRDFIPSGNSTPRMIEHEPASNMTSENVQLPHATSGKTRNGDADDIILTTVPEKQLTPVVKKRKHDRRNVAITSLLKSIAANKSPQIAIEKEKESLPVTLLKPTDFILTSDVKSTQVNGYKVKENDNIKNRAPAVLTLDPLSMFKKKTKNTACDETVTVPVIKTVKSPPHLKAQDKDDVKNRATGVLMFDPLSMFKKKTNNTACNETVTVPVIKTVKSPPHLKAQDKDDVKNRATGVLMFDPLSMFKKKTNNTVYNETVTVLVNKTVKSPPQNTKYVPSSLAKEYYMKYKQRSQLKIMMHDDIWTRAEKQMKEIDEQRKLEADFSQLSLNSGSTASGESEASEQKLEAVRLPLHRHLLTGECIVCKVLCRGQEASIPLTDDEDVTPTTTSSSL